MIIPIRCFTCNNKIANKYEAYNIALEKKKQNLNEEKDEQILTTEIIKNIKDGKNENLKSLIGQTLDELGIIRYCCRRHFIGHIELIQYI